MYFELFLQNFAAVGIQIVMTPLQIENSFSFQIPTAFSGTQNSEIIVLNNLLIHM